MGGGETVRSPPPPVFIIGGVAPRLRIMRIIGAAMAGAGGPKPPKAYGSACCGAHSDLPCGTCTQTPRAVGDCAHAGALQECIRPVSLVREDTAAEKAQQR